MNPIVFDGCFGWLHPSAEGDASETAVLLCSGIGQDARSGHRPLRLFAEALAASGYPSLRFDYPGVGDSRDANGDDWWSTALRSVHTAIEHLRTATGATRVVVCGFRFGALLAGAIASRRDDVTGLMLLAPVIVGRSYVREIVASDRLRADEHEGGDGAVEVDGLWLSQITQRQIKDVDLRKARLGRVCDILIAAPTEAPALETCMQNWSAQGARTSRTTFEGLEPMLSLTFRQENVVNFAGHLAWLHEAFPRRVASTLAVPMPSGDVVIGHDGCIDTPLRFGPSRRLFGMLCRPDDGAEPDLVVVIGNTGGDPHYGIGRFAVELARSLARVGIASLRIDFAGFGDSGVPDDDGASPQGQHESPTHVYETPRHADFSAALDALEERGYRRFAVQGLCSGAYHALQAAIAEPRFETLVLVNLVAFTWRVGDSIELHRRTAFCTPSHYAKSLLSAAAWRRVVHGQADVGAIALAQVARVLQKCREATGSLVARLRGRRVISAEEQLIADLAARRVRTLFVAGAEDLAAELLERHFGPGAGALRRHRNVTVRLEPKLDHVLSRAEMRQGVAAAITRFLAEGNQRTARLSPQRQSHSEPVA